MGIIWIVIIIWIIYSVSKNKKQGKNAGQGVYGRDMQNRQAPAPKRQTPAPQRQEAAPQRQEAAPQRQTPAPQRQTPASKRQTSASKRQEAAPKRQTAATDILQRAKASVEQEFSDNGAVSASKPAESRQQRTEHKRQEQARPAAQAVRQNKPSDENKGTAEELQAAEGLLGAEDADNDLMRKVEDLMVMGPDMKLPFSRDFVAEGVEMLNRNSYSEPRRIR